MIYIECVLEIPYLAHVFSKLTDETQYIYIEYVL